MPVHRHLHDKLGSVYAFRAELDAWWRGRSARLASDGEAGAALSPALDADPGAAADSLAAPEGMVPEPPSATRRRLILAVTALLLPAGGGVGWWMLELAGAAWRNPLDNAQFRSLTEFEGIDSAAAISRDGSRVAFLSDRDGSVDVWQTEVGSGRFTNMTRGAIRELVNPSIRTPQFSQDAASIIFWSRLRDGTSPSDINLWSAPVNGGEIAPYLPGAAELDWSSGGRLVYHTTAPGDPIYVRERGESSARQIYAAPAGVHCHFPVWSPDDAFVYFVRGVPPDDWDVWRVRPDGGAAERITSLSARVTHPVFLDPRTLLYLATDRDGSGPWLYAIDLERRDIHRLTTGIERYTSLAASEDASRLVVTVATSNSTLWRVPIAGLIPEESRPVRIALPGSHLTAPRLAAGTLYYVSADGGRQGVFRSVQGSVAALWSDPGSRIAVAPALSPDGQRLAVVAESGGRKRLLVMGSDGSAVRELGSNLELHGSPAWAPDGTSLVVAVDQNGTPRIFRFPIDGRAASPLVTEYSSDPVWSPDGEFLVYSGPDVGTSFPLRAAAADGRARSFPNLMLTRGARRVQFLPRSHTLVILRGDVANKNFWLVDLDHGTERQLTNLPRNVSVSDFDVSGDGAEIVFERRQESSDLLLIERRRH